MVLASLVDSAEERRLSRGEAVAEGAVYGAKERGPLMEPAETILMFWVD